jgi:PAS domain S-box-containing protein
MLLENGWLSRNRGTEQVKMPATLRKSQTLPFSLLVDSIEDYAIFMLDPDGVIISWNRGAEKIKGYTADEIIGKHFSIFYPAEDRDSDKPARELAIALRDGRVEDEGFRVRKDGTKFRTNVIITTLRDERGKLMGFAKITRDLSLPRAVEEELRRSEERFRLLVESVQDYAIFMLDVDGRVATWNRGAEKIKGYTANDIIGKHFSTFYPPEDVASGKPAREIEDALRDGRVEDEGFRVRKDGTLFWANVVITTLRDDRGIARGFAKVTRDLTTRRAAEEELRRSEERFRLLVDAVNDYAIYMLDPTGNVSTWNAGAARLKGYRAHEIVGRNFSVFFPEEDIRAGKPQQELAVALAQGRFEEEGYRVRKDGTRFWANVVLTPVRGAQGVLLGFAKVTRDLTDRMRAEETARELASEQAARAASEAAEAQVRRAVQRAEEANRVKDEFLATVSHELRTPLNAILGWSSLLRGRNPEPSIAKAIDIIHRNAVAQAKIIEDILDVSRIITGKLHLDVAATDLVVIVRDAIEVVRPSAIAKHLALEFTPPEQECLLVADPERLQQVAWNLLSNAVKFTDNGGRVTVAIRLDDAKIALSVSDTGRGIDPAFLPFVFDRFQQADSSSTRRVGGLGLGLAIVRHLVELHGGQVEAKSEGLGKGTTMTVILPIRAGQADVAEAQTTAAAPAKPDQLGAQGELAGTRVLVVDDEPDARELLEVVLSQAGATVETAHSAADGLIQLQRFRPHVLVSDIGMPAEDGYSFMQRVKALKADSGGATPAIALTAYTRGQDRVKALAMGFTTHLAKPVKPHDLIAAVSTLAARWRAEG